MTQSIWQVQGRGSELSCDVAIIGGGVIGCATAYWLSVLDPTRDVVIIDAGAVASGASGRNAGFLLQGARSDYMKDCAAYGPDRARRLWRFTRENRDLIFSELEGAKFDLESSGSMTIAGSEEEDLRLQTCASVMRSAGAAAIYFSADEIAKRLSSRGFFGGLYVPSGAMLNPVAFVRELAERSGARLLEHAPVRSIEMRSNGVEVDTDVRIVRADRVVGAANAWLPRLVPELRRYIRPVRAQMLATRPLARRWLETPIYSHDGYYYARQTRDGALLAGGARHLHEADEVGYDDAVTPSVQDDIDTYVRTHFSKVGSLATARRWCGIMGFSPDLLPVVGSLPGVPGSIWAGGFSGHGMGYAFRFGRLLCELLLDRREPAGFDLFSADRFTAKSRARAAS